MTDIKSMNEQELRHIVLSQSETIIKLINQLEAQETISEIQRMALEDFPGRYQHMGRRGSNWIPFGAGQAPPDSLRVLVKFATGYIVIATYFYRGIWKNDSGQEIDKPMYWKGLEE